MKKCILLLSFLFSFPVFSQWQPTKGPYGGNITAFYEYNNALYAGTTAGLFVSSDNGNNWKFVDVGFPINVTSIAEMEGRIFVGTYRKGVVCSADNGLTWKIINGGLSTHYRFCGYCIRGFSVIGNEIFAATEMGLYRLFNMDNGWSIVADGFFDTFSGNGPTMISSERTRYGPGCSTKITTDKGSSFRSITFPDSASKCENFANSLDVSSRGLFAVTCNDLFFSTDNGFTWTSLYHDTADYRPTKVKVIDDKIYLATEGKGLLVSPVNSISWTNTGFSPYTITSIYKSNNLLFIGASYDRGIYTSPINYYRWTEKNNGLSAVKISSIESHDHLIIAGGQGKIMVSTDTGYTWKKIDLRIPGKPLDWNNDFFIEEIATNGKIIMAASDIFYKNVFISLDLGITWTMISQSIPETITGLAILEKQLLVSSYYHIYHSNDQGKTWKADKLPTNATAWDMRYHANELFISSSDHIYLSKNKAQTWDSMPHPNSSLFYKMNIADSLLFVASTRDGLFSGSKDGSSWLHSYGNNSNSGTNFGLGVKGKDVFISDNPFFPGLMHSADLGQNWSKETIFASHHVEQLGSSNYYVYASTPGFGIWRYGSPDIILKDHHQYSDNSGFQVYPNPTSGIFTVKINSFATKLCVYDISGKCVYRNTALKSLNQSLDLSAHPKGIYFIEVIIDKKKKVKKIVLE